MTSSHLYALLQHWDLFYWWQVEEESRKKVYSIHCFNIPVFTLLYILKKHVLALTVEPKQMKWIIKTLVFAYIVDM